MTVMDYYATSDSVIIKELGERIRQLRLRKNITQETLAEHTLLAVGTIKSIESGKGQTVNSCYRTPRARRAGSVR